MVHGTCYRCHMLQMVHVTCYRCHATDGTCYRCYTVHMLHSTGATFHMLQLLHATVATCYRCVECYVVLRQRHDAKHSLASAVIAQCFLCLAGPFIITAPRKAEPYQWMLSYSGLHTTDAWRAVGGRKYGRLSTTSITGITSELRLLVKR